MAADWEDLLLAFLHDPPDKALDIPGHVARACRYASAALGRSVSSDAMKQPADVLASVAERFPAPKGSVLAVGPDQGKLLVKHPLSGADHRLANCALDESGVVRAIETILRNVGDNRKWRLLALWRLLPERLAAPHSWFAHLPADTRIPDHTIWHHLDTTTAMKAAEEAGQGAAFLSFSLGPVQSFIGTARSVRDLWSGSMILSWLTFQAMLPVIEACGPMALVYPHLRGIPFLDLWLREPDRVGGGIDVPDEALRLAPCLPNRFLALVPWGPNGDLGHTLAKQCKEAVFMGWRSMAEGVHAILEGPLSSVDAAWDRRWQQQIEHFWDIQTAVLPCREAFEETAGELIAGAAGFKGAFPDAAAVRKLADAIPADQRPGYGQHHAGRWQAMVDLSARLMQAQRSIRHVPPSTPLASGEEVPPKCSLMGSYEQMGPGGLDDSRRFWESDAIQRVARGGARLRPGERLCAVALVKRFCGPAFFASAKELGLPADALRFDDTASVAAAEWLQAHPALRDYSERQRSSHWLHWARDDQEQKEGEETVPGAIWQQLLKARAKERPPAYYAILMMDGDHLGRWLRGEKSPPVRKVMHPDLVTYFEQLGTATTEGLEARRPLGPALHAALSEALANFALHFVPRIVENHHGTLIYAGGDDVLALLPTSRALACALRLRESFRQNWAPDGKGRERLLPGETATVSAGLAVVHYKEDLRFALDRARKAEKDAKAAGRDALSIAVCRRSGEHSSALCPWDYVPGVSAWVEAFLKGASDRWAYRLAAELPTLRALDASAMQAEIRRQVNRGEKETRTLLGENREHPAGDVLARQFEAFCQSVVNDRHRFESARALVEFVTLCQSASFLARGREQ